MTVRDPIVIADAGPLIRLAAAGLLDAMRLTNRKIVVVDRIEEEACGDLSKPFAKEIADWMGRMGEAIEHAITTEGLGIVKRRELASHSPEHAQALKRALRDSGERAIREYVELFRPSQVDSVLVLFEDGAQSDGGSDGAYDIDEHSRFRPDDNRARLQSGCGQSFGNDRVTVRSKACDQHSLRREYGTRRRAGRLMLLPGCMAVH